MGSKGVREKKKQANSAFAATRKIERDKKVIVFK